MSVVTVDFVLQKLHPGQKRIMEESKRFNHLRCGRRFGKTTLIEELSSISLDGSRVGVWFPTYKDLSEVWKDLKKTYRDVISKQNEQLKQIELMTGGLIDFWSMEEPDSGQGRKYHRAIIDEAAKAAKLYQAWENTIRPTLTDYRGDAFILSRPKGKNNGFYHLEEKHKQFDNWAFFHFTTYDNPHIDPKEIEEAKGQLDDINFRQEYLAEYVDANDRPFLYAFDEHRHVLSDFHPNPHLPLTISFDFNVEPMTALIGQKETPTKGTIFDEMEIQTGSTEEMCDLIAAKYKDWMYDLKVTGDATGRNRQAVTQGNLNHYRVIQDKLKLLDRDLIVPRSNPAHKDSRVLGNSVLQHAEFFITKNCRKTIRDCSTASVDEFGAIIKTKEEGRHFFDNYRYIYHAWYPDFITNPGKYH